MTRSWGDFKAIAGKAVLAEAGCREALIDGPCRPGGKQRELRLGLVPAAVVFGALAVLAQPGEGPQTSLCHGHRAQGGFRSGSLHPSVEFRGHPCFFSKSCCSGQVQLLIFSTSELWCSQGYMVGRARWWSRLCWVAHAPGVSAVRKQGAGRLDAECSVNRPPRLPCPGHTHTTHF